MQPLFMNFIKKGGIAMNKLCEAIMSIMLREKLLQRFEKKVTDGEVAKIDVFLKRGTEYIVRGMVWNNCGTPFLSLGDDAGLTVPTRNLNGNGKNFSVIPEKDGLYQIRTAVKSDAASEKSATVVVSLFSSYPTKSSW
jgi:hypothetical protein